MIVVIGSQGARKSSAASLPRFFVWLEDRGHLLSAKHSHKHKKETSINIDCALNHCPVSFCEIGASVVDVFLVVVNIILLVFQVFF